jgi:hypothetical protein
MKKLIFALVQMPRLALRHYIESALAVGIVPTTVLQSVVPKDFFAQVEVHNQIPAPSLLRCTVLKVYIAILEVRVSEVGVLLDLIVPHLQIKFYVRHIIFVPPDI